MEIVRRAFDAFNQDGADAFITTGLWSPELVLDGSRTGIPGIGIYRGINEVKAFFEQDWFEAFPFGEWEIAVVGELSDHGDQVFVVSRQQGRGARSGAGAGAELELANIFTLHDGVITRTDMYRDRDEGLQAAGLSE
ncbi:MAG: nuclear transport factor 2 family protein [bacterium]